MGVHAASGGTLQNQQDQEERTRKNGTPQPEIDKDSRGFARFAPENNHNCSLGVSSVPTPQTNESRRH